MDARQMYNTIGATETSTEVPEQSEEDGDTRLVSLGSDTQVEPMVHVGGRDVSIQTILMVVTFIVLLVDLYDRRFR